ncbi:MAG: beta-ketoacyl-[acyl-carrier-protein] synthase family protein [Thermoguttaceae bacterium]|nr:beta-ketoacyl-[acyl-carrier-protein] synthase family protein [Thermoguttaceae bacterium]MDW8038344.1 beta-ketoacyl-[acyl-carrier-protein] synthase family protein [Thermoguttaceae bacterium]
MDELGRTIVITGLGIVSPIGIGREACWASVVAGQSGVRQLSLFDPSGLPVQIAGQIPDFDPKPFLYNRKALKVMARDTQLGVAAAKLAWEDAQLQPGLVDPERIGVVLGADRICNPVPESEASYRNCMVNGRFEFSRWGTAGLEASYPLSFLRVLPNMIACHISIAHDARGPNNTIHQGEVSSLLALEEAVRLLQRGWADVVLAGGASSQMDPYDWVRHCRLGGLSARQDDPAAACRPFDAHRDGEVKGEGAAIFVLERASDAQARKAPILGRILATASASEPYRPGRLPKGTALARVIQQVLQQARLTPKDLGHINAHGLSTQEDDQLEAQVLQQWVPDVPVTAPKSFFGNLGAASGATELAVSLLGLVHGVIPPTLNYHTPDPACPVPVVHGSPWQAKGPILAINWNRSGQAAALIVAPP